MIYKDSYNIFKPGDVLDTLAEANNTATDSMWTCNNTLQSTQRKIFVASFLMNLILDARITLKIQNKRILKRNINRM